MPRITDVLEVQVRVTRMGHALITNERSSSRRSFPTSARATKRIKKTSTSRNNENIPQKARASRPVHRPDSRRCRLDQALSTRASLARTPPSRSTACYGMKSDAIWMQSMEGQRHTREGYTSAVPRPVNMSDSCAFCTPVSPHDSSLSSKPSHSMYQPMPVPVLQQPLPKTYCR
jgi:hypothetical protein